MLSTATPAPLAPVTRRAHCQRPVESICAATAPAPVTSSLPVPKLDALLAVPATSSRSAPGSTARSVTVTGFGAATTQDQVAAVLPVTLDRRARNERGGGLSIEQSSKVAPPATMLTSSTHQPLRDTDQSVPKRQRKRQVPVLPLRLTRTWVQSE